MVSKEDWTAAISSEVFREYCKNEITKEATSKKSNDSEEVRVLNDFDKFEAQVKSNPSLRASFKAMQRKIASDVAYRKTLDTNLVEGVMLLDLEDEY